MIRLIPRSTARLANRNVRHVSFSAPVYATEVKENKNPSSITGIEDYLGKNQSMSSAPSAKSISLNAKAAANKAKTKKVDAKKREEVRRVAQRPSNRQFQLAKLQQWEWFQHWRPSQQPVSIESQENTNSEINSMAEEGKESIKYRDLGFRDFIDQQYHLAQTFRKARTRLWKPLNHFEEEVQKNPKEYWVKLTDEQRFDESLRVRYECIRRLGWRKGYTSGFPLQKKIKAVDTAEEIKDVDTTERLKILEKLGSNKISERKDALMDLAEAEEASAKKAWYEMDPVTRVEEEKAAWDLRDRSLIYIDETAIFQNKVEPRWFEEPQKVGSMIFLPNVTIRLVRNTVRKGDKYDAFKATFRVPLSMHKHSLRSYLLAIYGLRTTWCRSAIYRASITRTRFGQKKVGHSSRTFKKVEVGLLEPFIFPEITPHFRQAHMNEGEVKGMTARSAFKMSGKRSWRGTMPRQPSGRRTSGSLLDDDGMTTIHVDGMIYRAPSKPKDSKIAESQDEVGVSTPASLFRVKSIPTKKRSRILKLVHQERLKKEKEIASKMIELQKKHESKQQE